MLVLSRQRDERIKFENVFFKDTDGRFVQVDEFFVTICDIRGDKVRVGIDAPQLIGIDRCGPDGHTQTLTDEYGQKRQIMPPSPADPRPCCPNCHSKLSMLQPRGVDLLCLNCKATYPCPHTQRRRQNIAGGGVTEVCVNCRRIMGRRP